jgi:hypothetical protein
VIGITPKSRNSNQRNVFDLDQHDLFGAQKQKEKKQLKEHFKTQQNNIDKRDKILRSTIYRRKRGGCRNTRNEDKIIISQQEV